MGIGDVLTGGDTLQVIHPSKQDNTKLCPKCNSPSLYGSIIET
jgi:hypothetical protein